MFQAVVKQVVLAVASVTVTLIATASLALAQVQTPAQTQENGKVDVSGGFFSKEKINAPIADPGPPPVSSWHETVRSDTFAVNGTAKHPANPVQPSVTPTAEPDAQPPPPEASDEISGMNANNVEVDENMSEALRAAREVARTVNSRKVPADGSVPSPEYYQKAIEAVQGVADQHKVGQKKSTLSNRF